MSNRLPSHVFNQIVLLFQIDVALHMKFHQASDPSYLTEPPITFSTNQVEVFIATDISETLNDLYEQLIKKIDEF